MFTHDQPLPVSSMTPTPVTSFRRLAARLLCLGLLTAAILDAPTVRAQGTATLTNLYTFSDNGHNGAYAEDLIQGKDGNFYGTTASAAPQRGASTYGTIFRITPAGVLTTLYSFTGGNDGRYPIELVQGSDGNFYGISDGYTFPNDTYVGNGTIFKITPTGVFTTLYSFTGGSDGGPPSGIVQGNDGNFYGTTISGGTNDNGTIFRITPAGVLTTLYTFTGGNDGGVPYAPLVQGSDGSFYGTTDGGGTNNNGTVFRITAAGALTTLYAFTGGNDGGSPDVALVQGSDGNFYGATGSGGDSNGDGTIFRITPAGALTTLYTFTGGNDGGAPGTPLVQGSDGNFYGTTYNEGANDDGTIFEVTPAGVFTLLHTFDFTDDGNGPSSLFQGDNGNFYGTVFQAGGGDGSGYGTVFELSVPGLGTNSSSVQFTAASANVTETAGSVTLSVSRLGGSTGAISVDYTTADDTAFAGTDYQATSGTLTWADGDTTAKTITVPILNRGLSSGSTLFLVNLSNPTGGVTLASPTQAGVTILDTASTADLQSVTLLSPPNGVTLTVNQPVTLQADAEALAGTLANVEFFAVDSAGNSTDLGGTASARGQVTWQPAATGTYTLQVVATASDGTTQQATGTATVVAAGATLPLTNLQAGIDGITIGLGSTVPVVAQAVDSAGNALQNVQFYLDGVPISSAPVSAIRRADRKAADATASTLYVANVLASKIQQAMTAVGTTASGVSSVSTAATIYGKADAGTPPTATISSLASGASVAAGQSITVAATSGSQAIAKVQLVVDNQNVGVATAAPFTFNLPALAAGSHALSVIATDVGALSSVSTPVVVTAQQASPSTPAFFTGEVALSNGVYYLAFPSGNYFGYYSFLANPSYLFHFDLGFEYVFDAADGKSGVYFYDFASSTFFYTSPTFPFPYLYDFTLNSVLYYYPDPNNAGHYNTDGIRYFYDFNTGQIITK